MPRRDDVGAPTVVAGSMPSHRLRQQERRRRRLLEQQRNLVNV